MIVTKTVDVDRCYDCPHFNHLPHESYCELIGQAYEDIIPHSVAQARIFEDCPLVHQTKKVNASITALFAYEGKDDFTERLMMQFTFTDHDTNITYNGSVNDSVFNVYQEINRYEKL